MTNYVYLRFVARMPKESKSTDGCILSLNARILRARSPEQVRECAAEWNQEEQGYWLKIDGKKAVVVSKMGMFTDCFDEFDFSSARGDEIDLGDFDFDLTVKEMETILDLLKKNFRDFDENTNC